MDKLRGDLSDVSFEDLQKLQQKVGTKIYDEALFGKRNERKKINMPKREPQRSHHPGSKKIQTGPAELSSKFRVSSFREVVPINKQANRDPRFDDRCGKLNEKFFQENYSFVGEIKHRERKEVVEALGKARDAAEIIRLQKLLYRMNQQKQAEKKKTSKMVFEDKLKKEERELIKKGKKPFYVKKSDKKKLELAEKYKELKKSGKLEKYLTRRRKKNAQKDRKEMPVAMTAT